MRISSVLPGGEWRKIAEAAKAAEGLGYDQAQANEIKSDPFQTLVPAAMATDGIGLATSVAIAFPRSPMIVATEAWDIHRNSGGRFAVGLGSQVKGHNQRRFSVLWSPPAPRMSEYVRAMRAIWRCWEKGEPLNFQGKHYAFTLMTPEFAPEPTGLAPIPITIAAVGPAMLRLAGRHCDGARLHSFCTRKYIEQVVMPQIESGFAETGRTRANFEISGGGFVATGPDREAVRAATEHVRYRVAFYASTPAYRPVLELHGLDDLGKRLTALVKAREWDKLPAQISDEVLGLFAATGVYEELPEMVAERFGGAVDALAIDVAPGTDPAVARRLIEGVQAIPSAFAGFAAA